MKTTILLASALWFMVFATETDKHQPSSTSNSGTVTDIDGNTYKTVTIGEQEWMAENLNVTKFRNGDEIFKATNLEEWNKALEEKKPAFCFFNFDEENESKSGKLYNKYAINDSRNIAPEGFRVSTSEDWIQLLLPLGSTSSSNQAFKSSKELKSSSGWNKKNGNNEFGLNIYPNGKLYQNTFKSKGDAIVLWGGNKEDNNAKIVIIESSYNGTNIFNMEPYYSGVYVRCVKE